VRPDTHVVAPNGRRAHPPGTVRARTRSLPTLAERGHTGRERGRFVVQKVTGARGFYFLSLMARWTSRPASRVLMVSRRSYNFLPLASPSSTFAYPRLEK